MGQASPPRNAAIPNPVLQNGLQSGGWQAEKTARSGGTVEIKAISGTAAAEIEISPAGAGASITVKVIQ